jgi:uncharacterized cupredoxin-like copper-binding protein
MFGSSRCRAVGVMLVACVALVLTASVASAKAPTKAQVTVEDDFSSGSIRFDVVSTFPAVVPADTYKIQLINNSIGPHVYVAVGGLSNDLTVDDFIELLDEVEGGAPPPEGVFEAGAVFAAPGKVHQKQFDFTVPGQYGFFCPITTPAGTPHYKLGFVGLFDVAP